MDLRAEAGLRTVGGVLCSGEGSSAGGWALVIYKAREDLPMGNKPQKQIKLSAEGPGG